MISTVATKTSTNKKVDSYRKFVHIYKTSSGLWRGFVTPYDVTFEEKTKKKVEEILPKLVALYEDGLAKYKNPSHLMSVPLSDEEDRREFITWSKTMSGN